MDPRETSNAEPPSLPETQWSALRAECLQFARQFTHDLELSEDLTQSAIEKLLIKRNQGREIGNPSSYMKRIIRNEAIEKHRLALRCSELNYYELAFENQQANNIRFDQKQQKELANEFVDFVNKMNSGSSMFKYIFAQSILTTNRECVKKQSDAHDLYVDEKIRQVLYKTKLSRSTSEEFCEYWDKKGIDPQYFYYAIQDYRFFFENSQLFDWVSDVSFHIIDRFRRIASASQINNLFRADATRFNQFDGRLSDFGRYMDALYSLAWIPRDYARLGAIVHFSKQFKLSQKEIMNHIACPGSAEQLFIDVATARDDSHVASFDRWLATVMLASLYTSEEYQVGFHHAERMIEKIESSADRLPVTNGGLAFTWLNISGEQLGGPIVREKVMSRLNPQNWHAGLAMTPMILSAPYMHLGREVVKDSLSSSSIWDYAIKTLYSDSNITVIGGLVFMSHMAYCNPPGHMREELSSALHSIRQKGPRSAALDEWITRVPKRHFTD